MSETEPTVADLLAEIPNKGDVTHWADYRVENKGRYERQVFDPAAQVVEIAALLRAGGWDGDNVVEGVRGLIDYAEMLRLGGGGRGERA